MLRNRRWLRKLVFALLFSGPLIGAATGWCSQSGPRVAQIPASGCVAFGECFIACFAQGCCDYCTLQSVEFVFACSTPCVIYIPQCCSSS